MGDPSASPVRMSGVDEPTALSCVHFGSSTLEELSRMPFMNRILSRLPVFRLPIVLAGMLLCGLLVLQPQRAHAEGIGPDGPATQEGILELGRMLFFDPKLSGDRWVSCA